MESLSGNDKKMKRETWKLIGFEDSNSIGSNISYMQLGAKLSQPHEKFILIFARKKVG